VAVIRGCRQVSKPGIFEKGASGAGAVTVSCASANGGVGRGVKRVQVACGRIRDRASWLPTVGRASASCTEKEEDGGFDRGATGRKRKDRLPIPAAADE